MATYTNFDIIITEQANGEPEAIQKIHFSTERNDFPFDIFLGMLRTANKVEVQAWKPKATSTGLNAKLNGPAKAAPETAF
jgi:hypothetical protein